MTLIIGLLITAFILFFFEIFLPGGVLAVVGGIMLLAASVLTYNEFGLFPGTLVLIGGLIGALILFFLEIKFISRSRFGKQLALQSTVSAKLNPLHDEKLVGKEGVTLTILAPSGRVQIDGSVFTAAAEEGFLEKGVSVRVLRNETFKLIVTKK